MLPKDTWRGRSVVKKGRSRDSALFLVAQLEANPQFRSICTSREGEPHVVPTAKPVDWAHKVRDAQQRAKGFFAVISFEIMCHVHLH